MGVDTAGLTADLTDIFEDVGAGTTAATKAGQVAQAIHDRTTDAPAHTDTVPPGVNDDETQGYIVGSRWIIPGTAEYVCLDATNGAAIWESTTAGGSGGVSGPGSSTVGHVALWNDTTGDTLSDGGALAAVALSGAYVDLSGTPTLGTAASHNYGDFDAAGAATAAAAAALATAEAYADSVGATLAAPSYVTVALSGTLTNERRLQVSGGLSLTDGGAGADLTIGVSSIAWGVLTSIPSAVSSLSGTNTGDQTITLTGDVTGSGTGSFAATLASILTPATKGSATKTVTATVDAKGRVTAISEQTVTPAWSSITSTPTTLAGYGITDAQGLDATLTAWAGAGAQGLAYFSAVDTVATLTLAADKGIYATGAGALATYDLTAAGRALLDDADAAAQRTTLGLGTIATASTSDYVPSGVRPPFIAGQLYPCLPDLLSSGGQAGGGALVANRIYTWWFTSKRAITVTKMGVMVNALAGGKKLSVSVCNDSGSGYPGTTVLCEVDDLDVGGTGTKSAAIRGGGSVTLAADTVYWVTVQTDGTPTMWTPSSLPPLFGFTAGTTTPIVAMYHAGLAYVAGGPMAQPSGAQWAADLAAPNFLNTSNNHPMVWLIP